MLKTIYPVLLEEARKYGVPDDQAIDAIEVFEEERGYAPRSFGELLEVVE